MMVRRAVHCVLMLGFVACSAAGARAEENLIQNPGFEDGAMPPPHWEPNSSAKRWPAFGTYDTEIKHGGMRSFKMVRPMDDVFTYWYQNDIAVQPETDYIFGGWIKAEKVEGELGAFLLIFGFPAGTSAHEMKLFNVQAAIARGTHDWQEYKGRFRTPPKTHHVTFFLEFPKSEGTVWWDDLYIRRATEAEAGLSPPWARAPGVVAWQSFDDVVNGEFAGVSPHHVKGRLNGKDARPTADGKFGGAIEFTGPQGNASIGRLDIGDSMTVELWLYRQKQAEVQGHGEVIIRGDNWSFRIGDTQEKQRFVLLRPRDWKRVLFSKTPIPFDEWTHVAVTHDDATNTSKIYINGQLDAEAVDDFESFSGAVALCQDTPQHRFIGKMDEVGISRRVKSEEEIRSDMLRTEPVFWADNGVIKLCFEKPGPTYLSIFHNGHFAGRLGGAIAMFEKQGMGYKGSGVGSAYPTAVKGVDVKAQTASECVVDVTLERTVSEEAMRKFEATYRVTLRPGRSWFESRLVQVKNSDTVKFELRGYYHILQPKSIGTAPRCYGSIGGWVGASPSAGVICPDDFTPGFRKVEDRLYGEITRRIVAPIAPGTWREGEEPAVIIFAVPSEDAEQLYRTAREVQHNPDPPLTGAIKYPDKKSTPTRP
ncbi:MAG: LamG-like jellyroll fold domain-containing protein [Planctomycetota bacterium]